MLKSCLIYPVSGIRSPVLPWLAAFLFAGSLRAQTLWPGTSAGMTVEEVQRHFPGAHAPEAPITLPGGRGVELLELDQVAIANHTFVARFYFKDQLLVNVALTESGEISHGELEKFRDLLRRKYELERTTVNSESVQITWKVAQTTIVLSWTPLERGVATLAIMYEAPVPKENDRL